jgi:hypothetical protein
MADVLLIGLALREASRLVFGAVLFFRNPDKAAEPSVLSVKAFHCGGLKGTPVRPKNPRTHNPSFCAFVASDESLKTPEYWYLAATLRFEALAGAWPM